VRARAASSEILARLRGTPTAACRITPVEAARRNEANMRRAIEIGLLVSLALPGTVRSQGRAAPPGAPAAPAAPDGVVRGSIEGMNVPSGLLEVRTGTNVVTLEGTPAQLVGLDAGDVVQVPYVVYQGALWLAPTVGDPRPFFYGAHGPTARVTGPVGALSAGAGQITVRGTSFRIYPAQLQGIAPGMLVDVLYTEVGRIPWITAITPVPAASKPPGRA
jgi:hypothetical protein